MAKSEHDGDLASATEPFETVLRKLEEAYVHSSRHDAFILEHDIGAVRAAYLAAQNHLSSAVYDLPPYKDVKQDLCLLSPLDYGVTLDKLAKKLRGPNRKLKVSMMRAAGNLVGPAMRLEGWNKFRGKQES